MLTLCRASAALAVDQVVNNCSNDTELQNDWGVLQASGGGTLSFACGPALIVLTHGTLVANSLADTVIDGAGAITLSGGDATRILTVIAGNTVTLKDVTFAHGYDAGDGGCVWSQGVLRLDHAVVDHCRAGNDGGAILSADGSSVFVTNNSLISYNTATRDCGGICSFGLGLLVDHSIVDHNTSTTRYAGAIGGINQITINQSTISNNQAYSDGGAFFNNDQMLVQVSILTGNVSTIRVGRRDRQRRRGAEDPSEPAERQPGVLRRWNRESFGTRDADVRPLRRHGLT